MTVPRPAERILMELGIARPAEIDLEAVAWTLGAAVKYRPLEKCDAMIVGSVDRAVITISTNGIPERRRFSLGHEIGHWHLIADRFCFAVRATSKIRRMARSIQRARPTSLHPIWFCRTICSVRASQR
jgi:Zn-dependent peptidase ImmA (M78 family)